MTSGEESDVVNGFRKFHSLMKITKVQLKHWIKILSLTGENIRLSITVSTYKIFIIIFYYILLGYRNLLRLNAFTRSCKMACDDLVLNARSPQRQYNVQVVRVRVHSF